MKTRLLTLGCAMLLLASCSKDIIVVSDSDEPLPADTTSGTKEYVQYTIKEGEQYCDKSNYLSVNYSELAFRVKFDSSAIYSTTDPANQKDINKLFGFSDNNAAHHDYSARFGWRWSNNAVRLFAYTYNKSLVSIKELGTVAIGSENECKIKVTSDNYIFTLNGISATMSRASTTSTAKGYQLYPYFGGDEMAPHNIKIWIKQL